MPNAVVHVELTTDDVSLARKFYKKLFDWKFDEMKMEGGAKYTMVDFGTRKQAGGMMNKPMPEAPSMWMPYVEVADVKRTVAKAVKLNAQVIADYTEIGPGMGAMAVIRDPGGAVLGVWQPAPKRKVAKKTAKRAAARRG